MDDTACRGRGGGSRAAEEREPGVGCKGDDTGDARWMAGGPLMTRALETGGWLLAVCWSRHAWQRTKWLGTSGGGRGLRVDGEAMDWEGETLESPDRMRLMRPMTNYRGRRTAVTTNAWYNTK